MLSLRIGSDGRAPAQRTQQTRENTDGDSDGSLEDALSFVKFSHLPAEIRLMIWQSAFNNVDAAVAVGSFPDNRRRISACHPHSATASGSPPVAQACREARREWFRSTQAYKRTDDESLVHLFLPRTVFLLPPSAILNSQLRGIRLSIEHVAIDIAESPDIFLIFEALARFPRLRTIIVVIPSDAVDESQITEWQQRIRQDQGVLRRMGTLVGTPSRDGEWHRRTYMGWLLRNYLEGPQVRKYYAKEEGPKIRLFVDRIASSGVAGASMERPWELYFY